jgi:hypothetical protein
MLTRFPKSDTFVSNIIDCLITIKIILMNVIIHMEYHYIIGDVPNRVASNRDRCHATVAEMASLCQ